MLRNVGVFNIKDLVQEDPGQLADDSGISKNLINFWINKGKKHIKTNKL